MAPRFPAAGVKTLRGITRATPFAELPELLKPEEARAFLGIGRSALYDLLQQNALEHVRYGRLIRIPKTALLSPKDRIA